MGPLNNKKTIGTQPAMKQYILYFTIFAAIGLCSCGVSGNTEGNGKSLEPSSEISNNIAEQVDYKDLINTVYDKFVFAIDADPEIYDHPEKYFTANALDKLSSSYEFDCESGDCYAYYELRTREQDTKPGTDGESHILKIEQLDEDWYVVSYADMGWSGMTRIKIDNGKIDDYQRCVADL